MCVDGAAKTKQTAWLTRPKRLLEGKQGSHTDAPANKHNLQVIERAKANSQRAGHVHALARGKVCESLGSRTHILEQKLHG
jgi:hypothetical protein